MLLWVKLLWAPVAVMAIGVYQLVAGDPILASIALCIGIATAAACIATRRR